MSTEFLFIKSNFLCSIPQLAVKGFVIGNPLVGDLNDPVIFRIIADNNRFYAGIYDKALAHAARVRIRHIISG